MTPAERVADAVTRLTLAQDHFGKAIELEIVAFKELRDGLKEAREKFEPSCNHATKAANEASELYLDAKERYDAAFKAAMAES